VLADCIEYIALWHRSEHAAAELTTLNRFNLLLVGLYIVSTFDPCVSLTPGQITFLRMCIGLARIFAAGVHLDVLRFGILKGVESGNRLSPLRKIEKC